MVRGKRIAFELLTISVEEFNEFKEKLRKNRRNMRQFFEDKIDEYLEKDYE